MHLTKARLVLSLALLGFSSPGLAQSAADIDRAADDFRLRCSGSGVVKCVGFDSREDFSGGRVSPAADGRILAELDTETSASGAGSLRFTIPTRSPANSSGYWLDSLGKRFGPGDTLHLQFRQRFSKTMLETQFEPVGGWKQFILYPAGQPSCTTMQFVMNNGYLRGFPTMYASCGRTGFEVPMPNGDIRLQQGDVDCRYQDKSGCMRYRADQWMTFYFEIELGQFDSPTSHVRAWMGYAGKPLRQVIDFPAFNLEYDSSPSERLNQIQFTPYQTNKDPAHAHPAAYTWYDELIVSTEPIAAPGAAGKP